MLKVLTDGSTGCIDPKFAIVLKKLEVFKIIR